MSGPKIVSEFPYVAARLTYPSVVHLPHSNRPGDASRIRSPSIEVIPMDSTMGLIWYHSNDCMVEEHLALLGIPDVPIMRWLVYTRIMQYILWVPSINIP